MTNPIINDFKNFDWQKIIDYGNGLDDLNDAQLRFVKGRAVELAIEKFADGDLKYVGEKHRDYVWPKHNLTVEAKSQFSAKMFDRKGNIKEEFDIKINNSNGTNKKTVLPDEDVADYVIVIRKDGAFAIDKQTVISRSTGDGDGFVCKVNKDEITPLTGRLKANPIAPRNIGEGIDRIIRESLDNF
jgi:hypothetical protein